MQNSEKHIDGLFHNKLHDHEVVPPPAVWDNIESSLDGKNRKKRMILIWGLSMAASLMVAFLAGWYFSGQVSPRTTMQAENTITIDKLSSQTEPASNISSSAASSTLKQSASRIGYEATELKSSLTTNRSAKKETITNIETSHENRILSFLSSLKANVTNNQKASYELIAMNDPDGLTEADKAIIARNMQAQQLLEKGKKKANSGFAIGVQGSPVYRFETNNVQSGDYANLIGSSGNQEYKTNMAGGVVVTYNAGNRFSFQTGVSYDEISQTGGEIGVSYDGQNWMSDRFSANNFLGNTATTTDGATSNTVILNTNMGLANITMPQGTEIASGNTINKVAANETRNLDFKQNAGYIEIPMIVRYKVIDNRLGLHVLGGINTNVLMSNEASLSSNNEVVASGKTEGLNALTFSSSFGLGMSYALSKRFNLSVEPTMKFQLNSLNNQDYYDARPYTVGIFTGITYQF